MDSDKLDYFMERTKEDFEKVNIRLDKLWDFRLMILGGSFLVSAICSIAVSLGGIWLAFKK